MSATVLLLLGGCPTEPTAPSKPTLYQRVGEVDGLRPVVDDLVWRLAGDDLIAPSLAAANFKALKKELLLLLCSRSGGPCLRGSRRPLIVLRRSDAQSKATARLIELAKLASRAGNLGDTESIDLSKLIELDAALIIAFVPPDSNP